MSVQRGEIVLVDFPYSDRSGSGVRPALVVQADDLNASLQSTILAMITSSSRRRVGHPSQYEIDATHPDFPRSGLRTDSLIQCNVLVTLQQDLVLRCIGSLSDPTIQDVEQCLKAALGIA